MKPLLETDLYKVIDGRHGRFLVNPHDQYIGRSLLAYGEYSEPEWQLLKKLTSEGGTVIEAGANIGSFTVPLASKVGRSGLVYAFEPQLAVFQQLCANLALNDLVNVQAFNAGCAEKEDWMSIARPEPAAATNFGGLSLKALERPGATRIRLERLDRAIDPPRLDLIKADVEGMELEVLKGAAGLLERFAPLLYLEAHDPNTSPELIGFLEERDHEMWWHLPPMFRAKNHAGKAENIFGNIVSFNLVAVPRKRKIRFDGIAPVRGRDDHPTKWPKAKPA